MPEKSKYNRARIRSRVRRQRRSTPSWPWVLAVAAIVILGIALIAFSIKQNDDQASGPPRLYDGTTGKGDHWHSYIAIDLCGQWVAAPAQFESAMGIHTHGDGLIHIHPFNKAATGKNATVGRFFKDAATDTTTAGYPQDWEMTTTSFSLWNGAKRKNGDTCESTAAKSGADNKKSPKGQPGEVSWALGHYGAKWTGKAHSGDLTAYHPQNGDIIGIYFLPKGSKLPEPPDANQALANIQDLNGASAPTAPGATTTKPATPAGTPTTTKSPTP
jgi:hypothetical protein